MPQRPTPTFSAKAFVASLFFVIVVVGFLWVSEMADQQASTHIQPVVTLRGSQQVFEINQFLKTDSNQNAELMVGQNKVVLDQSTEIQLQAYSPVATLSNSKQDAQLSLKLLSGRVWVEAPGSVEIKTDKNSFRFDQSLGVVDYNQKNNQVIALEGGIRIELEKKASFYLPLNNAIAFSDGEIIDEYFELNSDALQKTLGMFQWSKALMAEDPWLFTQLEESKAIRGIQAKRQVGHFVYQLGNAYHHSLLALSFLSPRTQSILEANIDLKLDHVLSHLNEKGDLNATQALLAELEQILNETQLTPALRHGLIQAFQKTQFSAPGTPAFALKQFAIEQLAPLHGPELLAMHLSDAKKALDSQDQPQAQWLLKTWEKQWAQIPMNKNLDEYNRQSQQLNHILLSHTDLLSIELLDVFNQTGRIQLEQSQDPEKLRYELLEAHLMLTDRLVNQFDYLLARDYLRSSYTSLNINLNELNADESQTFLTQGTLLAQRIQYALDALHGAAEPINEVEFAAYVEGKKKESALADELITLLQLEGQGVELTLTVPSINDIRERFLEAGITLSTVDITADSDFAFSFKEASYTLTRPVELELIFEGSYDYISNTLSDIKTQQKAYNGSVAFEDLDKLFQSGTFTPILGSGPRLPGSSIDELLADDQRQANAEDQALSEDLAIKLAITQLNEAGIEVSPLRSNIEILDPENLNQFWIKEAQFIDPEDEKEVVMIQLNYSTLAQMVTHVKTLEEELILESAPQNNLLPLLHEALIEFRADLAMKEKFIRLVQKSNWEIDSKKIIVLADSTLKLVDLSLENLPLTVNAIYNPKTERFETIFHPLYTGKKISPDDYFEELVDRFIIQALIKEGIAITTDQVVASSPFSTIQIKDVEIGPVHFNFMLDLESLQPANVRVVETGASLGNLTFNELEDFATSSGVDIEIPTGDEP